MQFSQKIIKGQFLKRYKRFFADFILDENTCTAHVPNTGSLKSCSEPGSPCLVSKSDDPNRKLKYTLEAIQAQKYWVGVNTSWPNKLAVEIFEKKLLDHWKNFDRYQLEVKISDESRIDLLLWESKRATVDKWKQKDFETVLPIHVVEIKNVTLRVGNSAQFPDAVTERGQKHIRELVSLLEKGYSTEMLFIVQRDDVEFFQPAYDIDPKYGDLLKEAQQKGVIVTAMGFNVNPEGIVFSKKLPIKF